jgi:hypothetical protein
MNWIVFRVWLAINIFILGMIAAKHGQMKDLSAQKYNFWTALIGTAIELTIILWMALW